MNRDELDFLSKLHERSNSGRKVTLRRLYRRAFAFHAVELIQLAREALEAREEAAMLRRRGRDRPSFVEVSSELKRRLEIHAERYGFPGWASAARGILSRETTKG